MKKVNINDGRPVIVGGGIAGLTAGLILCKPRRIIEASDYWGGLLRSEIRPPFGSFDIGSHVISETGINDLDKPLFDHVDVDDYCLHESLPNNVILGLLIHVHCLLNFMSLVYLIFYKRSLGLLI